MRGSAVRPCAKGWPWYSMKPAVRFSHPSYLDLEVKYMCQYFIDAGNTRDARQGEDLVVSRALHGRSNWLTVPGSGACAVCIPSAAILAVQLSGKMTRGVRFVHNPQPVQGHYDFLQFLDGDQERVALDNMPLGTGVRVLMLFGGVKMPGIPREVPTTVHPGVFAATPAGMAAARV